MKTTIPQVSWAMRHILGELAELSALKSGFTQRKPKLNGSVFVQTQAQAASGLGVKLSPQAADCLREVLEAAVSKLISAVGVAIPGPQAGQSCSATGRA